MVNSCWALWILICVTALPSRLESRMRRRPLPIVEPKPRSNGSTTNLPYVAVSELGDRKQPCWAVQVHAIEYA